MFGGESWKGKIGRNGEVPRVYIDVRDEGLMRGQTVNSYLYLLTRSTGSDGTGHIEGVCIRGYTVKTQISR